jgi:O-antigen/teichoic acid export membrane protein
MLAMSTAAGALATAAAGYVVGYLIGPQAVELLLGAEFRPEAPLAALAACGVVLATFALLVQQMLVAMRATGLLAAAWLVGLAAAAITIAAASGSASMQVGWAFLIGEATAFALLVAATLASNSRSASGPQTPR